ncbi:hypothetical protein V6N11_035569 [Hibiscus sabdariffa]|uniref:Uncharacterized protein n=1 Tax=Hibiscus sabdariffa TaxID=183260 RepID=A0ABR2R0Z9_9ROSI
MEKGVWLQREMLKTFNEMHPLRPDRYGVVAAAAIRKQAAKPSKCTKRRSLGRDPILFIYEVCQAEPLHRPI